MKKERTWAGTIGILGLIAVLIQMFFSITRNLEAGKSLIYSLNHFFSYFTISTNTSISLLLIITALSPQNRLSIWFKKNTVSAAFTVYILVVGIVYYVLLLKVWKPTSYEFVANHILHAVVPLGYSTYWFLYRRTGELKFSQTWPWLWYPGLYFLYLMIRGSWLGVYPYFFVDVSKYGLTVVLMYAIGILSFFKFIAYLLVQFDRRCKKN